MTNAPPARPHDGDTIRYERPEHIDIDTWREIVSHASAYIEGRLAGTWGACKEHPWCTLADDDAEHVNFHCSRTLDLIPGATPADVPAMSAWITEDRGQRPRLVVEVLRPVVTEPICVEIDLAAAVVLLIGLEAAATGPDVDPLGQLLDLAKEIER